MSSNQSQLPADKQHALGVQQWLKQTSIPEGSKQLGNLPLEETTSSLVHQ